MSAIDLRGFVADASGGAIDAGALYIGTENADPEVSPVAVYWDSALTQPATQPISLSAGYIIHSGARARLYTAADAFSYRIRDRSGAQVDYAASFSPLVPRSDITGPSGAGLLGFSEATSYSPNTVGAKLKQMFKSLDDYGDTSTTAGAAAALAAYLADGGALAVDKPYAFPTTGGPYDLGAGPIYPDADGALSGDIYLGSDRSYQRRLPVAYNDGAVHFNHTLGKGFKRPFEERERPLDLVTDPGLKIEAIDLTAVETSYWTSDASDAWTAESPTTTTSSVAYGLTNDGHWHVTWVPVQGGMDVTAFISGSGGGCSRGVFIRTTGGFEYFYAADSDTGVSAVKLNGAAPSLTTGVTWLGQDTLDSYQAQNSVWTVRALQARKYAIMLNGTEIFPARSLTAPGEIIAVGFGAFGAGTASISVLDAVRRTTREATGAVPLNIGITGNSISDPTTHGCWDMWMRDALDGAMGLKVLSVTNLAVSGANSLAIAGQIAAGALGASNVCLIVAPEVNDVQEAATAATTTGNISAMIDTLLAATLKVILVTGYLWYPQSLASGQGQNTSNYAAGAEHRAALRRLAASKGVQFFDLAETSGPLLPAYLATPTITDTVVRDNIHPTAWYYRRIGEWMAKAILRAYRPKMSPFVLDATFPSGNYVWTANSWTTSDASYSLDEQGFLFLNGQFTAGTKTDATTVFTLPAAYRPAGNRFLTVSTDDTNTGRAVLQCQADGACKIYSLDASATFIRVNGGFFTGLAAL